ncbi:FAD-dependent monooxygenase [Pseudonocardia sp. DLS-67]
MSQVDVVVVGAGPAGLLLAGDLAAAGVRVTVLERRLHESNLTRAFVVHARTLEQLDARGVADQLLGTGTRVDHFRLFGRVSVDLSPLPSRFPFMLVTPQYEVEKVLAERAQQAGVTTVRGADVRTVHQTADHVEVTYTDPDGAERTVRAAYLVGADGHRSVVRGQLGLAFPGKSVAQSLVLADVRMTNPPTEQLTVDGNAAGFCFVVPFGDGWYRIIVRDRRKELPDDAPVEPGEIEWVVQQVFGTDFGIHDPRWMSRFHSDERQAERYRVGRVFLVGDAAHVHSPAGGMGMNTGLQDAADLGWKLAAAVQGRGGDRLLDTYQDERHPVGRMVLRMSGGLLRAALLRTRLARAIRNVVIPAAFAVPPVGALVRMKQSGIGISYGRPRGAQRQVGTRAADVTAADGTRLYEALRRGRFVLVAPAGFAVPDGVVAHVVPGTKTALLVRPDGYVAWAARTADGLQAALSHWGAAPAVAA